MARRASMPAEPALRRVLFLCTANYYRSRCCEELFNHHAARQRLQWQGLSRALRESPSRLNPGPISPFALDFLRGVRYGR